MPQLALAEMLGLPGWVIVMVRRNIIVGNVTMAMIVLEMIVLILVTVIALIGMSVA